MNGSHSKRRATKLLQSRAVAAARQAAAFMGTDPKPAVASARCSPQHALTCYQAIVRSYRIASTSLR